MSKPQLSEHPARILQRAMDLHRHGRLGEAEQLYRTAAAKKPQQFEPLHFLGVLKLQQGDPAEAIEFISAALRLKPHAPEALSNLGAALSVMNRHEEALAAYDGVLRFRPADVEALYNRGVVLSHLSRPAEALASYEKALAIRPDHVPALFNRGNVLAGLGRPEQALESYDKLLALLPRHVDALNNRGNVLATLGRLEAALACYERVLALKPDHLDALTNCGNALKALCRHDEALSSYERALALEPGHADALNNRGNALQALRRYGEALASYEKALALAPKNPDMVFNYARALQELDLHEQAVAAFDAMIGSECSNANALYSRGNSLIWLGRIAEAIADHERALAIEPDHAHAYSALLRSRMLTCDWERLASMAADLDRRLHDSKSVIEPFQVISLPTTPAQQLRSAQRYVDAKIEETPAPLWRPGARHRHKIRIGYFSADFRGHVVASVIAQLFELHDRAQFEVIGISFGPDDGSELRSRIANAFDQFHDVRFRSDREIATLMHELGIDIAVDLTGHTAHSRTAALAYRPCPVQVSYLGYPGTTGAAFIDYVIADETALPLDQQPFFAESIVHLPDCYQPHNSRLRTIPAEAPARTALGLPERGLVFCAFTNSYKITAPVFEVWMRLLQSIPGSVLWLSQMNELAERNLRRETATRGIDPERLIFAPRLDSFEDHLARHRRADLYLDTLPYNAHTTAANAVWAGLPVLTCKGDSFAGRVGASVLRAAGLPELVTDGLEEYEALAMKLATEPGLLPSIRRRMDENRSKVPLFDSDRFRRRIETAYLTMWSLHRRGEPPRAFRVDAD